MKAIFYRKISDLNELKKLTEATLKYAQKGQPYIVTTEVILNNEDFQAFASDFLADHPWITKETGGVTPQGEERCIRVINEQSGQTVLVNSEGHNYARYTSLEIPDEQFERKKPEYYEPENGVVIIDDITAPPLKVQESIPIDAFELKIPLKEHDGRTLCNLIKIISREEQLIVKVLEQSEPLMDEQFTKDLSQYEITTFEEFQKAFEELEGPERCPVLSVNIDAETYSINLYSQTFTSEKIAFLQTLFYRINLLAYIYNEKTM
ncbi:DUF6329 domain-containing protein [Heliorestis convoluta]|uniref:Uncharacterized protein n=1 Tax=Heliorestis convoluta TaxID=356322 RepID=A0A5Q2N141_9FIRM|nr:DUF6329 domain-containing protein [Heliorestis convoluta]QGG47296.1 hypothetical protein FTV88_1149 [Heliorestis convoluta]